MPGGSQDEEPPSPMQSLGKAGLLLQSLMAKNSSREVVGILGIRLTGVFYVRNVTRFQTGEWNVQQLVVSPIHTNTSFAGKDGDVLSPGNAGKVLRKFYHGNLRSRRQGALITRALSTWRLDSEEQGTFELKDKIIATVKSL
jgi:hypothetical protein